jgi:hypothetical protein
MTKRNRKLKSELEDDGYIDEIAVEVAVSGVRVVRLTQPERELALDVMLKRGDLTLQEMATRVGSTHRRVRKYLEEKGYRLVIDKHGPRVILPTNLVQKK